MLWLQCCITELEAGSKWVLPALKHFGEVCSLYPEVCVCVCVCLYGVCCLCVTPTFTCPTH